MLICGRTSNWKVCTPSNVKKGTSVIVLNVAACFTPFVSSHLLVDLFRVLISSVGIPQ